MNVLVVDDDRWSRQLLERMLGAWGHGVRVAVDGAEALEILKEHRPDAVISDIMMPRVDGFQLCRRIREQARLATLPIVLLSACYRDPRDKQLAREAGADFYLEKPVQRLDLEKVLNQIERTTGHGGASDGPPDLLVSSDEFAEKHTRHVISKLHEYAMEVTRAHEQLKRLDEVKDTFVAIAGHELRTPIAVLAGYCRLLSGELGGQASPQTREFVEAMNDAIDRLERITRRLLQVSQLEDDKGPDLPREPVDLLSLVNEVVDELRPFIVARSHEIRVTVPDGVFPRVPGVAWGLRQTIAELIQNAIKFTPDGGEITVDLSANDANVILRVRDTGIGISECERERVFDKFYEIGGPDKHTTGTFEFCAGGLGLGLSLAKSVVKEHGGEIRIEEAPGRAPGTVVHLEIPRRLIGRIDESDAVVALSKRGGKASGDRS